MQLEIHNENSLARRRMAHRSRQLHSVYPTVILSPAWEWFNLLSFLICTSGSFIWLALHTSEGEAFLRTGNEECRAIFFFPLIHKDGYGYSIVLWHCQVAVQITRLLTGVFPNAVAWVEPGYWRASWNQQSENKRYWRTKLQLVSTFLETPEDRRMEILSM